MASTVASDLEDSIAMSVLEQCSPELIPSRALSPQKGTQILSRSTSNNLTFNHEPEDDYFGHASTKQCNSSRSSISSFPSSVIHNLAITDNEGLNSRTPSRSQLLSNGRNSPAFKPSSNSYLSAFRHPNSVRALQLESEYADSDSHSISRSSRHRKSPKTSYFSPRSPGSTQSSPTKRSTRPGTPQHQRSNSKLRKEFPLVLLHCTLLPPATTTRGSSVSEEILEAVLPEDYRKRWRTMQDKVTRNPEVKQRGVLIAHPRDDYDLLEERLLEALELERPRIRKGHYMGSRKSDSDSGFESSSQNGTDDGSDADERGIHSAKETCPDCGKHVSCKIEQGRKWEVKIFAANGLMRSDAWSAAWEQMEKIDVEVAIWMPEDVRFEVEERLKALQAMEEAERPVEEPTIPPKKERTRSNTARLRHDERMREIYGEPEKPRTQEEIDGLVEPRKTQNRSVSIYTSHIQNDSEEMVQDVPSEPDFIPPQFQQHEIPSQLDFLTFMKHHFWMIVNDQRNLAIVLLSALVLFFSVQNLDVSKNPSSRQSEAVQSVSISVEPVTEISVMSVGTPIVSYITTTVLATPSNIVPIAPSGKTVENPQVVPHVEDHTAILRMVSNELFASSIAAEPIPATSNAEPEIEATHSVPPLDDQPHQSDLDQAAPDVEVDIVIGESAGAQETTVIEESVVGEENAGIQENVNLGEKANIDSGLLDISEGLEAVDEITTDTEVLSQDELPTTLATEISSSQELLDLPEDHTRPSTPSNDLEQSETRTELPTVHEPENNNLFTRSDPSPISATDNMDIDSELMSEPECKMTSDRPDTKMSIHTSTPKYLFTLSNKPNTSPLHSHLNFGSKDTAPSTFNSNPTSLLRSLTDEICTEADHGSEFEQDQE